MIYKFKEEVKELDIVEKSSKKAVLWDLKLLIFNLKVAEKLNYEELDEILTERIKELDF